MSEAMPGSFGKSRLMVVWTNRRIAIVISAAAALLIGIFFVRGYPARDARLNVLLVTLDTTRADRIGCYGYRAGVTPVLDELARRGMLFERAYAPAPQTLVSHATMLTGLNPPEHGLRINGAAALDKAIPTLATLLAQGGYQTAAFVAASVLDSSCGLDQGFETYDDDMTQAEKSRTTEHQVRSGRQIVDAALAWLQPRKTKPFFCWCHLFDPHVPRQAHPQEFGTRFRERTYDGEIAYADLHVGRLVEFLRKQGLENQTLVIVVGDHGEGLGEHGEDEHGYMIYNSTMRVPLIVSCPPIVPGGTRTAEPVALVDLLPTVLDCVGMPTPLEVSGRSLQTAFRANPLEPRACYGETDAPYWEAGWSPLRSITTEQWKYIRTTRPELFDLHQDPNEQHNLADQLPDQLKHMEKSLSDLERGMVRHEAKQVVLSAQEQRALRSLGYTGGGTVAVDIPAGEARRDIKDTIAYTLMVRKSFHLLESGDLEQVDRLMTEVLTAVPDYALAHAILGACRARQARNDEAVEHLQHALELAPDHTNLTWVPGALGQVRLAQQKYELALEQLSKGLQRTPEAADLHVLTGIAFGKLGRVSDAVSHFESALKINPKLAAAEERLGDLFAEQQDLEKAGRHYEAALRLDPGLIDTRDRLAGIRLEQGAFYDAIRQYEEILRIQPGNANNLVALSLVFSSTDSPEFRDGPRALTLAKRACQLTANREPVTLDALAAAYAELKDFQQAVASAEKAHQFALDAQRPDLAEDIARRLQGYRAKQPYRTRQGRLSP